LLLGVFLHLILMLTTSIQAKVVINEIMYHHPANEMYEMFEFVELFNTVASPASIAGWQLKIGQFYICPHRIVAFSL